MDFRVQSALYAAIVALAVAVAVLLRARRSRLQVLFATLSLNLFLWRALAFLYPLTEEPLWQRAEFVAACFIPMSALRFYLSFPEEWERRAPAYTFIVDLLSVGFACVVALTPLHQNRAFGVIVLGYIFVVLYLCSGLVYRQYRRIRSEQQAARLKYLFVGGFVATSLALLDHLPVLGVHFPSFGNVAIIIYLYLLYQTIIRHRLLDLNEFMGRSLQLGILAVILATGYALVVLWSADSLPVAFLNSTIASLLIIIVFDPLRTKVEEVGARLLFRQTYELEQRLSALRKEMANVIELRELWTLMLRTIEESRRATHASIYLLAEDGMTYVLATSFGPPPPDRLEVAKERPLIDTLRIYGEPIVRENLEREIEDRELGVRRGDPGELERLRELNQTLQSLGASLVLPFRSDETMVGLLCLQDERLREAYSPAEIALLRRVAAQAVINIENSRLYARIQERDRLAALGEMAAGLAHEIRNPLGAIKGAAQYLAVDPEQPGSEFLSIIIEEVNRLNHVVSQFLDYARPYRGQWAPLDLNDLARKTVQLVRPAAPKELPQSDAQGHISDVGTSTVQPASPPIDIVTELAPDLPPITGDIQLLKQVLLNLLLNAREAMPRGGRLVVRTRRMPEGAGPRGEEPSVELEVADTGEGISQKDQKSIFIPFFTTKERGTGLGLAICQRIIEGHGGTINLRSRKGLGTTFTIHLPVEPPRVPPSVEGAPTA